MKEREMSETLEGYNAREAQRRRSVLISRHSLVTRVTHWINLVCVIILLMSGLQIFNAHPALYWGQAGADPAQAWLEIGAREAQNEAAGFTRVGNFTVDTTGILGLSRGVNGNESERAFPRWLTLPSWRDLSLGRRWHFFFAWLFVVNLLAYLLAAIVSGHLRRDLLPSREQLRPRALLRDIADHLRLKFPQDEAARHYNPLQKFSYLVVALVLLPVMVLTGLSMSPGMDAVLPWLIDIFGGRQSARSIHFLAASLIVLFVLIHVLMVILAGPKNELRSMITGKFAISPGSEHA
jgi:thiosulfate reductase cytochrome b subunit